MSGTELLGTIQSYWELLSQKSLSVLMTSDRRKRRAGVYRRREARQGQGAPLMGWATGARLTLGSLPALCSQEIPNLVPESHKAARQAPQENKWGNTGTIFSLNTAHIQEYNLSVNISYQYILGTPLLCQGIPCGTQLLKIQGCRCKPKVSEDPSPAQARYGTESQVQIPLPLDKDQGRHRSLSWQ